MSQAYAVVACLDAHHLPSGISLLQCLLQEPRILCNMSPLRQQGLLLAMMLGPRLQEAPQGLQEVLKQTDATGRMRIIQQMSINIIPIVEKGLLDPVITHGWVQ